MSIKVYIDPATITNGIAVDGPEASGKGTIAKLVADRTGLRPLDTGSLYRAVTWCMNDSTSIRTALSRISYKEGKLFIDGQLATDEQLRSPEITKRVPTIAAIPQIRKGLLPIMQEFGAEGNFIAEGRDIGTVVFPFAKLKFFLTATPETRAERKFKWYRENGNQTITFEEVFTSLLKRDDLDITRKDAPLKQADDAVVISVEDMSAERAAEVICLAWKN